MVEIGAYTGAWEARGAPEIGTEIRVNEPSDARELIDLRRALSKAGRAIEFYNAIGRASYYVVVSEWTDDAPNIVEWP